MSSRLPMRHPALRVIAAGCIVLWLMASSYCSIEHLFAGEHDSQGRGHDAEVANADSHADDAGRTAHRQDAAQSHDGEKDGQDSHPHDDQDDVCCSTLHATAQTPQQLTFGKPIVQPVAFLGVLLDARELFSTTPERQFDRYAKSREWVFTPEVCLGPAFRSLAPPVLL